MAVEPARFFGGGRRGVDVGTADADAADADPRAVDAAAVDPVDANPADLDVDLPAPTVTVAVDRWQARVRADVGGRTRADSDGSQVAAETAELADEVPVAFEYNGISHAVMLATPTDLDDFALGFTLSEAIATRAQFYGAKANAQADGVTLSIDIAASAFARLKERRRTLVGRTGCGICGTESLAQVLRPLPDLSQVAAPISAAALQRADAALPAAQRLQKATGATHGAAWCSLDGELLLVREDVGRHNALDKLIGALAAARRDPTQGFALVTSRASVEMVQKAATAGIAVLAAVSAPTALGVRTAQACGMTLIGFARGDRFSVYAGAQRVVG